MIAEQKWKEIEAQCLAASAGAWSSAYESWMRRAYSQLSDSELEHFASLMEDPVMIKAQGLAASPEHSNAMTKIAFGRVSYVSQKNMVNSVLRQNGLAEAP